MKDDNPNLAFSKLGTLTAKKITWAMAGLVTDPGRYMFKFGWLTITADDLAIWQAYPNAMNWSQLPEQKFRVDKWSLCRG
jgi:hypothetical protein